MQAALSYAEVASLVTSGLDHTRPVGATELRQAINYGYAKAIRAILSVRPQFLLAVADPFVLASGINEYDIGAFDPPLWRPYRLKVLSNNTNRTVRFRYRALVDVDFEDKEDSTSGIFNEMAYDILEGMLASPFQNTISNSTAGSGELFVSPHVGLEVGQLVRIPGAGLAQSVPGVPANVTIPGPYYGTVISTVVKPRENLIVSPVLTAVANGAALTILRRRVLKVSPTPRETLSGQLFYNMRPPRLMSDTDLIEPTVSEHIDTVVHYAMAILKRAVGDTDSRDYFEDAQSQRAELMADLEPLQGQSSEALGSDLYGD